MTQTFSYKTKGTCSSKIDIVLEGDIVKEVKYTGGCNGNLQGISRLVEGQDVHEVVSRLEGIRCGFKSTSCPDQLANALKQLLEERKEK